MRVLARLRGPGGCAWDAEQTHSSLVKHLIEETYELVEAIEQGSREDLIEELGDVLYQVLFHSDIAAHTPGEEFDINDVAQAMTRKMVARHPHVFGDEVADSAELVMLKWDQLKAQEKPERTSVLDGIPLGMPSLLLADKIIGRAAKVGVAVKELDGRGHFGPVGEFDTEEALGEVLLSIAATARGRGWDAERALRGALRDLQAEVGAAEGAAGSDRTDGVGFAPGTQG